MRLLIYEWCCSGGLSGSDAPRVVGHGDDTDSLAREGRAMLRAVVADAVREASFEVVVLVDRNRPVNLPAACRTILVPTGGEVESLVAEAAGADATIVVAPETADVLASRVAAVRAVGGRPLAPGDAFLRLAADKQATIDVLAAAGVPVPAGRALGPHAAWPDGFHRPAVRKARSSTGCDGLVIVGPDDRPPSPAPVATRLEAWCGGEPVGVSCLLGPCGVIPVAAMRQRFSSVPATYVGGDPLVDPVRRARAERLAVRAVEALLRHGSEAATGWVGVDIILGARCDDLDDRVLEVNPRVTTSFVGAAAGSSRSVVRSIVDVAAGRPIDPASLVHARSFTVADEPFAPSS